MCVVVGAAGLLGLAGNGTCARAGTPLAGSVQNVARPVPQNTHLHYSVFVHGYHVVDADADYAMPSWGYGVETHLYTVGLASWFLTLNLLSNVQGRFEGEKAVPLSFDNHGFSRGEQRHAHIDYDLSGPHVTTLTPPENGRDPLPEAERRVAVDMLSYLAGLTHRMTTRRDCNFGQSIFDGVHLSYLDMHGPVSDTVPHDHHPVFKGEAMRCDFTGRQIGGFSTNSPYKAAQATPHPGSVWFIQDRQAGILPVRIEFTHPKMGLILVVLQQRPGLTPLPTSPIR